MNEQKTIKVRRADGGTEPCTVDILEGDQPAVVFSGVGIDGHNFSGIDLFDAFNSLRRELESMHAQAICAGARRDVFPSGMSRSMSGGRKAYITRPGSPTRLADLVDIFDEAPPESVGTVAEQAAFHKEWGQSLGR